MRDLRHVDAWPGHPLLARVLHAAEAIELGDVTRGRALADSILEDSPANGTAAERVARVFALSLLARLAGDVSGIGNLYLRAPGPGDMLAAFDVLVERTPFVRFGYASANAAITDAIRDAEHVHLIDVGFGSGTQWLGLLQALAHRAGGAPTLRLTGIDLPAQGKDDVARLNAAGWNLEERAESLGVPFEFEGIASAVEDVDFEALVEGDRAAPVVNAAFALHHVPAGDGIEAPERGRDAVLRRIHACDPEVFTLVEPDVEHNAVPFLPRVRSALTHYAAVFDALGTLVPDEPEARRTLEHAFFGREILNVVVGEGPSRIERHEGFSAWIERLHANGFKHINMSPHLRHVKAEVGLEPPCRVDTEGGGLLLTWRRRPLVAASAWRAGPG